MKLTGFAQRPAPPNARPLRSWRLLCFVLLVSALAVYVISKWQDFAMVLSGIADSVPAATGAGATTAGEDFLIEFKLDREKTEKEQVDMLKHVMDDTEAGKDVRDAARAQYLAIVDAMGKELKIEGLLKARGFESVAFLSSDACTVVVRSSSMDEKAVAQIGDTVHRVTRLSLEKITVIPAS